MRNRCKARLADRLAAFGAGTEGSSLDAGKGCLYGGKLLLTRLTQTFEHLVIVALDCPVVIIGIAGLIEVRLDLVQTAVEFVAARFEHLFGSSANFILS